uniref:hypothetical protein n=1 Tax=Nocardia farcinica TaxID=37329 RepID=UPI0024555030
ADETRWVASLPFGVDTPRLTAILRRDCRDEGAVTTVRLQPDGSLAYSTPGLFGGSIAGILRRG